MLTCQNISLFSLNTKVIFTNLSITLLSGAIVMIRGKNGAGKTSLLRIISGIQTPSQGEVFINNVRISELARPFIGYLGHRLGLKLELTVEENLIMWAKFYSSEMMIPAAVTYFSLQELLQQPVYKLSSGMKKKVALARLMSCHSKIWLLDEVEANLDEENRKLLYNAIAIKASSGGIILWASHLICPWQNIEEIRLEDFNE